MTGPTVIYIGGFGRSGSTLLERLLGQLPGVTTLGEVVHLWSRGVRDDDLCGCGEHFSSCPFWTQVGRRTGGWSPVEADRMVGLRQRVDRLRHVPRLALGSGGPLGRDLRDYLDRWERLYAAAAEASGARVLVDSSKHGSTALALSHSRRIDLRLAQIVRDPRGVAHSWAKEVVRPESGDGRLMPRYSPARSSALWLAHNATVAAVGRRTRAHARVRYEDLVARPAEEVALLWERLDLPGTAQLDVGPDRTVDLRPSHSVAGNPMRFTTGRVVLEPDQAWRRDLPAGARRTATAVGLPLMAPLGYLRGDAR